MNRSAEQSPGLASAFLALLARDLTVTVRRGHQWLNPLLFFIIVVSLFPLGVGPNAETLAAIAPGVIWVGALLATLLSLDSLFTMDHADGSLEQVVLTPQPLSVLMLAKVMAHWLITGIPLILVSPLLVLFLQLPLSSIPVLALSLALGTLSLSLIGAIGAALTVGVRHGGVLLALLILPLFVPILIFGAGTLRAWQLGLPTEAQLSLLGALAVLSLALAPLATAAAIRIGVGND
ncbi:MAG: heme exporter protein CcmB [Gammaproteobacteria bacterium]|nr:heme exporter protein CcmB [Gammaproteobacteria bacterium]